MNLLPYTKSAAFLLWFPKLHMLTAGHYVDGGWTHGRISNGRYYWKPDLYDTAKKFAELEEDRDAGKEGAHDRLKSFREKKILLADSIVQVSYRSSCTSCYNNSSYRAAPNLKIGKGRR
jgi:hypothetical protein